MVTLPYLLPKGVAKLTNKKWLKMTLRKLICDTEHSPVMSFNDSYHCHYHVLRGLSWPWHYVSHTFWKSGLTFNTQTKTRLERKTIQKYHISHPASHSAIFIEWRQKTNILDLHHEQNRENIWSPIDPLHSSVQSLTRCLLFNFDKILRPSGAWWVILSIQYITRRCCWCWPRSTFSLISLREVSVQSGAMRWLWEGGRDVALLVLTTFLVRTHHNSSTSQQHRLPIKSSPSSWSRREVLAQIQSEGFSCF